MICQMCKLPIRGDEHYVIDHYTCSADFQQSLLAEINELAATLQEAVRTIRVWHGMGMGPHEAQAWALYQASPEMKRINAALENWKASKS